MWDKDKRRIRNPGNERGRPVKHITKIIIGAAFLVIGGTVVMGNGQKIEFVSSF